MNPLQNKIATLEASKQFEQLAFEVFQFQFENNTVYRSYCDLLYVHPAQVNKLTQIPFLPIDFFKSKKVISGRLQPEIVFSSSGTTGAITSKHYVAQQELYIKSFTNAFSHFYGDISEYVVLGLLPSYLEREGSSLVYMVNHFIENSGHPQSGFYLHNYDALAQNLRQLDAQGNKVLLIGVSYALLDLVEKHRFRLQNTIVMETGGMKGRRTEMIRPALHQALKSGFGVPNIHSEYGMTELLSQAYSKGEGRFECPPTMRVFTRDTQDPFAFVWEQTGGINIIDLSNLYSCSFIATQDLGKVYADGSFEVLGRFDHSDVRGCNLMAL